MRPATERALASFDMHARLFGLRRDRELDPNRLELTRQPFVEKLSGHRGRRGFRLGRLVVQSCTNGWGAPFFDHAFTHGRDEQGNEKWRSSGRALSLVLRRNRYGERRPGRALYVGWVRDGS